MVSTPTSLKIPRGVDVTTIKTKRGDFAAHDAHPVGPKRGQVLLVPGFTGSKEDFTPILAPLASEGWHVTAYDQRGQFETPGASTDDYSIDGFAADALALREVLSPDKASVIIGHSFGGLVSQSAVIAQPGVWRGLGLLCSGPGALGETDMRPLAAFITAVDQLGLKKLHEVREAMSGAERPADIARFLAKRFAANSPVSIKAIADHLLKAPDRFDEVVATNVPIWVARGVNDDAWPHELQSAMAARARVDMVIIDDAGHSPAIENTDETVKVVSSFLNRVFPADI